MTSRPRQIVFWLLVTRHSGTRPAPGFSARHLRSKPSVREPRAFPSAHSTLSPGGFLGDACAPNRGDRLRCFRDRKSTRLNSSHTVISYAVFCLKKKKDETKASA